jgi:polysaccharide deacetylase 2 family uncharacterized protein YibQ
MKRGTGSMPVLFLCAVLLSSQLCAQEPRRIPVISIIIDDMGTHLDSGERVLRLHGPVACSFLPDAAHTGRLAEAAFASGKEIMLHLPMESADRRRLDDGALTLDMTRQQFSRTLRADLASVPHVQGVNNHMGSLLTRHPGHMLWLMQELQQQQSLFFVDSRTTAFTVARQLAQENGIPNTERNVFLDDQLDELSIKHEFERLLNLAREKGSAVAIGHPHPQTLALLERQLPRLAREQGIRLIPVGELIRLQQKDEQTWQASLSPSHRVVKNSKLSP